MNLTKFAPFTASGLAAFALATPVLPRHGVFTDAMIGPRCELGLANFVDVAA